MSARSVETPLGRVTLTEEGGMLTRLDWGGDADDETPVLREAETQLMAYFEGRRRDFQLPTRVSGSEAQRRVCAAMAAIPSGDTRTYGDLARELGLSAQAVGQLCGGNPIPIIIPCHRVLGAQGLGGFSAPGGIETKVWLLKHERAAGLLI
jgi:methylated-DNA-[protein]-cysteine S-methyltransferase